MEKRKSARFDVSQEMKGKLLNVVGFLANNISGEGINLVSGFQPVVGSTYRIYLMRSRDGRQQDFEIEINRAEVTPYDSRRHAALPPGLLFSIGAHFKGLSDEQKTFLGAFMKGRSGGHDEGLLGTDKVTPGS